MSTLWLIAHGRVRATWDNAERIVKATGGALTMAELCGPLTAPIPTAPLDLATAPVGAPKRKPGPKPTATTAAPTAKRKRGRAVPTRSAGRAAAASGTVRRVARSRKAVGQ